MERAVLAISPVHSEDWRTEIISFLHGNCLSDDEAYNKRMEARTRPYVIIEGELYKHGVCSPLLKCLSRAEGIELMKEIHAGLCGSHIGSRPLLGKVFRQGFYWPKAALDAAELVQKCENCQKCAKDQKQPSSLTQLIQPTWPLQRWGLYLLGPLPPAQGNLKYVVVAVEYFYKWIETKPLATITSITVQKFFWQNIVCRFRVTKAINVDNGTQFDAETFKDFCDQIGTKIHFASVRHLESNGVVERENGIIMMGIMKLTFNQPCWGPLSSEGPQKCNLTMFPKYDLWTGIFGFMVKADTMKSLIVTKVVVAPKLCGRELWLNRRKREPT
jgi:hypothetical protein